MTGLMVDSVNKPSTQLQHSGFIEPQKKPCIGCGKDISELHGNRKRCAPCHIRNRKIASGYAARKARADQITNRDIVQHMQEFSPGSLKIIKDHILTLRRR